MKNSHNSKSNIYLLTLLLLLISGSVLAESKTKVLKPKNSKEKITIVISGKNRSYYDLSKTEPLVVTVKGPGRLKILIRSQINSKRESSANFAVNYSIDGMPKINEKFRNVEKDVKAKFADESLGTVSEAENVVIELGRGEHTLEMWRTASNDRLVSRFLFTPIKENKISWVSMSPMYPNEPVSLVTNEDLVTYYRFSLKKPLKIRITGPTTLRILSRVENRYQMKGTINYRLQVKENGKVKNTYLLNSNRSEVTVYRKNCGRTPGKAKEIVIYVPKGTHVYEVLPLDKDKDTILARVLFPKKDVKIKE
jgi:hypothetical protein